MPLCTNFVSISCKLEAHSVIMKSVLDTRVSVVFVAVAFILTACGGVREGDYYPEDVPGTDQTEMQTHGTTQEPGLFSGALSLGNLSGSKRPVAGLGVNGFLWRATLDTLSFMPLTTADPTGGVVITDWHANPQVPDERFKLTVYILDTHLRADGVKVSVFRQEKVGSQWQDAATNPATAAQLENQILRRARELKVGVGE